MSETKHTPGPWRVVLNKKMPPGNCGIAGIYNEGSCLTVVKWPRVKFDVSPAHRGEANAHLIAAAPDMLEALEIVQRSLDGKDVDLPDLCKKVAAAIAKAKREEAQP